MEDRDAIERSRAGDRDAFGALVERYERRALAHAFSILSSREAARDAVQEAFVDAFRALGRFDDARPFYPWLHVLLRHRCYKALAKARYEPAGGFDALRFVEDPAGGAAPEDVTQLNRALEDASAEDRELLLLKYVEGLTYGELAERLGVPAGTVMSRLFHARRRLRVALEGPSGRYGTEVAQW